MNQGEKWLLSEKYHGMETEEFRADCARLAAGEPLAYVIGHTPFLDATIYLRPTSETNGPLPLIPRPETEYWVNAILDLLRTGTKELTILDLCAGSGCIGVAALMALPHANVHFAEIETAHHEIIAKNIEANGIAPSRTRILGGDLFETVHGTYDVILSNPPYIDPALDRTEESVRTYEPHRALYGGPGGHAIILRIIEDAPKHLTQDGILVIEHEPEQVMPISDMAKSVGFDAVSRKDQYGIFRYTVLTRSNR